MPVLATASLTKRYPRVTALDELTVEVGSGVTGLVGANGAGKSTLLKILLGLIAPTAGSAIVLGHDVVTGGEAVRAQPRSPTPCTLPAPTWATCLEPFDSPLS